jgi:hypothetical protein
MSTQETGPATKVGATGQQAPFKAGTAAPGGMTQRGAGTPTVDVSALRLTLRALEPLLADPEVTEVCINRPQEAFVETGSGWRREPLPFASFDWCRRLAKLVANSTRQRIDEASPLLSASLPGGERIQIVLPPATTRVVWLSRSGVLVMSLGRSATCVDAGRSG